MNCILEAQDLCIHYNKTPILWDVSFKVPKHHMTAIVGPNGAGKSTLLKASLQIIKPFSGSISFGRCNSDNHIAYVPQKESIDWDFPVSALDVVLMGRYGRLKYFQRVKAADKEAAMQALQQVGMASYSSRQINQLSGGQQQRLFIARALVQKPDVLLLDEPFSGIDMATEKLLIELFIKLKNEGKSIFIVHHDLTTLDQYFDWVILINTRLIGCGPVKEVMTQENIQKAYGNNLSLFEEAHHLSKKQAEGYIS
ncbi:MAG: manganese ABC transporter ATP-binding protein [Chlamydiae bacterium CG10_big_fil_rev_8_21_14_0_10_35_9]|nr:MAG: manganese ABC transporter ATP-binding protein [Chlamydiae bacterium CG10_big_fil_rev_8_21_14_0_10_35_9]